LPVVKSENNVDDKPSVHKGVVYLIGLGGFIVLWLIAYGSNILVYSSQLILPIFIPILASIPVAFLINRISRVYPGSAKIFGYVATSLLSAALAVIALVTLSNGQSWLEISVAVSVISLIYPVVAIGFSRGLEVFMEKLGLHDGAVSQIEHYDTIHARKKNSAAESVEAVDSSPAEERPPVIKLVDVPNPPRDFSKAVKTVTDDMTGVAILEIDFDELQRAERPIAHQKAPTPAAKKRAPRKPRVPKTELPVTETAIEAPSSVSESVEESPVVIAPKKPATPRKRAAPKKPATEIVE